MADAIHAQDPERLIICDGLKWAGKPVPELLPLNVAQATRGYTPMNVTHYGANWVDTQDFAYPTWPHMVVNGMLYAPGKPDMKPESFLPMVIDGPFTDVTQWDQQPAQIRFQPMHVKNPFTSSKVEGRQWLKQTTMPSWLALQQQGVGVMVGEFGCYNRTPHDVALAWMEDCLANWKQANWGWALWNFRGSFGIFDSHRRDVDYENFHGHKLDRQMLDLLQKY